MFEPVFVSRNSDYAYYVKVVPAHIGIVKINGCYQFEAAVKDEDGDYGFDDEFELIVKSTCRQRYGAVPKLGEAYLVEEGRIYIHWTRVDEDMYLLDSQGNIIKED